MVAVHKLGHCLCVRYLSSPSRHVSGITGPSFCQGGKCTASSDRLPDQHLHRGVTSISPRLIADGAERFSPISRKMGQPLWLCPLHAR